MNKLISTVIGLLISFQLSSQTNFSWGFKGGITVSKYSQWNPTDTTLKKFYTKEPESRVLVNIAFFAEGLNSRFFSTVGEIAYNPKGASFGYPTLDGSGNVTGEEYIDNRTGYISLTVCEKAKLRWKSMNIYIYAGPRLDLEINENSDIDFTDTYKKFNKIMFGLTTGFGVEFIDKHFKILTEVQYEPDLGYTLDDAFGRVKKNTWLVRIGVGIIGKK
ncbi:MAG TPA: porin family protein [Ignavibacteria bacterium]|nr:porin family protein [Ignavibacteria bacterium]